MLGQRYTVRYTMYGAVNSLWETTHVDNMRVRDFELWEENPESERTTICSKRDIACSILTVRVLMHINIYIFIYIYWCMHWIKLEHVYMTLRGQSQCDHKTYHNLSHDRECPQNSDANCLSSFRYKTPKPTSKFHMVPQVWPRSLFEVLVSKIDIYFGKFYLFIDIYFGKFYLYRQL